MGDKTLFSVRLRRKPRYDAEMQPNITSRYQLNIPYNTYRSSIVLVHKALLSYMSIAQTSPNPIKKQTKYTQGTSPTPIKKHTKYTQGTSPTPIKKQTEYTRGSTHKSAQTKDLRNY